MAIEYLRGGRVGHERIGMIEHAVIHHDREPTAAATGRKERCQQREKSIQHRLCAACICDALLLLKRAKIQALIDSAWHGLQWVDILECRRQAYAIGGSRVNPGVDGFGALS